MTRRYQDSTSDLQLATDEELVGLLARRDEGAIRELFRRYAPYLIAMARRMGFGAESLRFVQDTFVRLWDDSRRFDPVKMSAQTWIVTAAHRLAVNRLKANAVPTDPQTDTARRSVAADEGAMYVSEVLDRLDPLARELLELAFFGGYDHDELVGLTGRSPATVKTTMRRALASLHDAKGVG